MRICFFSDFYPTTDPAGGIGVYTQTAAHALAVRGHEVHVLLGRRGESADTQDGPVRLHLRVVHWIPVLARWLPGLGESICLAWALFVLQRKHRFDVVEFPNWEGIGLVSAWLRIAPIVVRIHTSMTESVNSLQRHPTLGEQYMIWAERTLARLATATVTHSLPHRDKLAAAYGLSNIHLIPHGILIPPQGSPAPERLAVLYVGAMNARKGIDTFLAAVPLVLQQVANAEFWLVGRDRDHLLEVAFRQQNPCIFAEQVRFLGFVPAEKLCNLYASCAVYASASIYESFGLTFVEAMAYGKPVVGCAISAMLETVQHEQTGLLVPPNDPESFAQAIVRLLQDPPLRQRFGEAGYRRAVENYSAERMAQDIEVFFVSVAHRA